MFRCPAVQPNEIAAPVAVTVAAKQTENDGCLFSDSAYGPTICHSVMDLLERQTHFDIGWK